MAGKVQQLSDFIVTKANDLGLSITQVVNVDDATIIAAIPEQHLEHVSDVVFRKAKRLALLTYVDQKAAELADNQSFKDAVSAIIPELVITKVMIEKVIVRKIKELRA